jgi:hypothetical protein
MRQVVGYLFLTYVNVINKLLLWERNTAQKKRNRQSSSKIMNSMAARL